jgi:hypothetical protein
MAQTHVAVKKYFRKLKDPRLNRRRAHALNLTEIGARAEDFF